MIKKNKSSKSSKLFNLLARRAYKLSKKKNLGWKWQDAQKWTSRNLYQQYKGSAPSKLRMGDIDRVATDRFEPEISEQAQIAVLPKEICDSPFLIPTQDLEDINWWNLDTAIDRFPANLNIAVEFDGIINTGIVKKSNLPDLVPIREAFRKFDLGSELYIVFKILVAPDREDDGKACSYYVLCTLAGSAQDNLSMTSEIDSFTSESDLPEDVRERRRMEQEQGKNKAKRASKKEIKNKPRPEKVEAQGEGQIKLEIAKYKELNKALLALERSFKQGLITKKQFQARQELLLSKFSGGGLV